MLTIKRSSNVSIGPRTVTRGSTKPSAGSQLGTTSRTTSRTSGFPTSSNGWVSESAGSPTGTGPNITVSSNPITLDLEPMLAGITPQLESRYFYTLYRDIYYQDPVGGSAVDLISTLPFGEFSLGAIPTPQVARVFHETLERLNMRTLIPEISVDYLVLGSHTSSLLYNKEQKRFTDIMPHAIENLTMMPLPFYSQDPIITVKFDEKVRAILARDTPRIRRLKAKLGTALVQKLTAGELELDPLSTLYIPRKTFSTTDLGTSYYKRMLPIYLIEKNLFRGTLVESARRQRGIMHITLGDGDQWEPSVADMEFITDLFMNADSDPLGAIIATRMGISTEELRQGGEFWKVTDFSDSVLPHKYRALAIGEGLLSGEASYNTADTSLSVFMDTLLSFRDMMTRKLFYGKLFPLISMLNGYTISAKGKLSIKDNLFESLDQEEALSYLQDGSKLLIPTVSWAKQLKPGGDNSYMDLLNGMSEKGIPVPLRTLAAAGGLNLDDLLRQQEDDLEIRKKVADYKAKLDALLPKPADDSGGDDVSESHDLELLALASADPTGSVRSAVQAHGGKPALFNRDFGSLAEITDRTKTGKVKMVHNQRRANEKINLNIVRAMREAQKRGKFESSTTPLEGKRLAR